MAVDLRTYRENKETIKNIKALNGFFVRNYPEKSTGWVGITSLLYSQTAIMHYLEHGKIDPNLVPALKSILWQFLNDISSYENSRKEK